MNYLSLLLPLGLLNLLSAENQNPEWRIVHPRALSGSLSAKNQNQIIYKGQRSIVHVCDGSVFFVASTHQQHERVLCFVCEELCGVEAEVCVVCGQIQMLRCACGSLCCDFYIEKGSLKGKEGRIFQSLEWFRWGIDNLITIYLVT